MRARKCNGSSESSPLVHWMSISWAQIWCAQNEHAYVSFHSLLHAHPTFGPLLVLSLPTFIRSAQQRTAERVVIFNISFHPKYFFLTLTLLAISSAHMFLSEALKRPMFENSVCCIINYLLHYKVLRQSISQS